MKPQNFACSQCCRNTKRHQFHFEQLFIKNHLFSVRMKLVPISFFSRLHFVNLLLSAHTLKSCWKTPSLYLIQEFFFFHLEHPSLLFLPKLQWNSKTRRMGQETDGGKTCWNFLLLSDLQGFSAAITQKCYQMLLAIVGPKKIPVSAQSQPIFQDWEKKCFPHKCFLLLQFMPIQFWNFIMYLLSFFFAE